MTAENTPPTKKKFGCLKGLLILFILLAVVLHFATPLIGRFAANQALPEALNTEARLDHLGISLLGGRLDLRGLHIAQPEGFEGPPFVEVDRLRISLPLLGNIGLDPLRIRKVHLDGLRVHMITNEEGSTNANALGPAGAEPAEPSPPPGQDDIPPVWVQHILLENIQLVLQDLAQDWELTLQDIRVELKDLAIMNPRGPKGPATLDASLEIVGPEANAQLRVMARIGEIRPDRPEDPPVMQLAVGLIGFDMATIRPFLVPGVRAATGWSATDFILLAELGPGQTPEERIIYGTYAMTTDSGTVYAQEIGGTLAAPRLPFLNVIGDLVGGQLGRITRLGGNIAEGGLETARAAFETGAAAVRGAAGVVTGAAGGILRTARGVVTLDGDAVTEGLRDATVGTVTGAAGTVTDTLGTATGAVGRVIEVSLGRDEIEQWWNLLDVRMSAFEEAAEIFFAERPFPTL